MSTPKNTSPIGFDLVRMTWLSAAPASPDCKTLTVMPVCFVNAANTDFDTANESWVTSVIVVGVAADAAAGVSAHADAMTTRASSEVKRRRRIRRPFRGRSFREWGRRRGARPTRRRDGGAGPDELVAHAAGRAGWERLAVEREAQPVGEHTDGRATQREE